ncbi:nicotinate-nicotinamide nucleotide adenylyltransferase [Candidatus Micrarchaeota archaeon]|nr:nicotinate-nicotinamide nucleotide adenylyltransferase [Candidatus Micrarchaeota archaeon]
MGHVHVVFELAKRFDEVWIVVASDPDKREKPHVPPAQRLHMAEMAFGGIKTKSGHPVKTSDVELKRPGVSFTVDTVRQLQKDFSKAEFTWVIGSDLLADFPRWKDAAALANLVPFLVVYRPGFALRDDLLEPFEEVEVLEDKGVDASSTLLRQCMASGQVSKAKKLLPAAVFNYVLENRLYL